MRLAVCHYSFHRLWEAEKWDCEKLCAEVGEFPKNQDRMVVEEAFWMEVDRRTFASGWFWRRWRRPDECEKWRVHVAKVLQIMLKSGRSS